MSGKPQKIVFDLGGKISISPPLWVGNGVEERSQDLLAFAPQGNGVYGYQDNQSSGVFKGAPTQEACGGVIYFGNDVSKEDFLVLMRIMAVQSVSCKNPDKRFSVFTAQSDNPGQDGYLTQMRIVSRFALRFMFRTLGETEYDSFPEQGVSNVEALWAFMEHEREVWGTSFAQDRTHGLRGLFGGDGNFAREELSFGFTVENEYHGIYRIWSRAWLVTK